MSSDRVPGTTPSLAVRQFRLDVDTLPTHWFDQNLLLTHAINAQILMFPALEQLVVRAVRPHRSALPGKAQRKELAKFIGQELQHGRSHDDAVDLLRDQGHAVDGWLEAYHTSIARFERWSPLWLRLSVACAIEHYTACIAECWLTEGNMEAVPPPDGGAARLARCRGNRAQGGGLRRHASR
jgi:predicted metal-dependent hydrolase